MNYYIFNQILGVICLIAFLIFVVVMKQEENMDIFKLLDTIVFIYCLIMMYVNKENVNSLVFFGIIAMIQTMIMISWRLQVKLLDVITVVFVILKLLNLIDWSWWAVFSPQWISILIYGVIKFLEILIEKINKKQFTFQINSI